VKLLHRGRSASIAAILLFDKIKKSVIGLLAKKCCGVVSILRTKPQTNAN